MLRYEQYMATPPAMPLEVHGPAAAARQLGTSAARVLALTFPTAEQRAAQQDAAADAVDVDELPAELAGDWSPDALLAQFRGATHGG